MHGYQYGEYLCFCCNLFLQFFMNTVSNISFMLCPLLNNKSLSKCNLLNNAFDRAFFRIYFQPLLNRPTSLTKGKYVKPMPLGSSPNSTHSHGKRSWENFKFVRLLNMMESHKSGLVQNSSIHIVKDVVRILICQNIHELMESLKFVISP